ncbi:hypothetical protein BGW38_008985 [Lunasporangiospora selenospora]|uniref:RING-type domain-containing protein n=1 Tax=Lunasporangiospora selenospora TaxID=979761 RepID=A0A9P6G4K7_9FUNG|nr:hypothetical protein BGW38_008985 [Lunasporangiospora selenospora]
MYETTFDPMFTSYGYQPSVLWSSPPTFNPSCPSSFPSHHHDRHGHAPTEIPSSRQRYVQVWLDANPTVVYPSDSMEPGLNNTDVYGGGHSSPSSQDDEEESFMEWESCLSFPVSHSTPVDSAQVQAPALSPPAPELPSPPMELAFQQHKMYPLLPVRSRSSCMFLGVDPGNSRLNRRLSDLLNNTSLQRIRSWLKTTIEPNALEQWRHLDLYDHLARQANISPSRPKMSGAQSLGQGVVDQTQSQEECPICFRTKVAMKRTLLCQHHICWKCEQGLIQAENVTCPLCRRLRLFTVYVDLTDMFKSTIGLHPRDYTHPRLLEQDYTLQQHPIQGSQETSKSTLDIQESDDDELLHEMADRYCWETSASFLEHLQGQDSIYIHHPAHQYFQLNAAKDLCEKPSTERYLPEYSDQALIEPPLSGLVLPPHRLYIALVHFCIDLMTFPGPVFQSQPQYKREMLLLKMVTLFLVPTDEFSPREPDRIFNIAAWLQQGQLVLNRIHVFICTKARQNALVAGLEDMQGEGEGEGRESASIPSIPISREILYLGSTRWTWIAQSLALLLTWIKAADANPSIQEPVVDWSSILGKHDQPAEEQADENPHAPKRRRVSVNHHRELWSEGARLHEVIEVSEDEEL